MGDMMMKIGADPPSITSQTRAGPGACGDKVDVVEVDTTGEIREITMGY